jgi:hypothetical protein
MAAAAAELNLLKTFSGTDEATCVEHIDWTSAHVFSNGLRAPPWRQDKGDLGYILINPHDGDNFDVLVSRDGFHVYAGAIPGGDIDYTRIGELYPTLSALLEARSPHFHEKIAAQEARLLGSRGRPADAPAGTSASRPGTGPAQRASSATRTQRRQSMAQRTMQPSSAWTDLGLGLTTRAAAQRSSARRPGAGPASAAGARG